MRKDLQYPIYRQMNTGLYVFLDKDKMYKIEMIGSNMNPGITIDYYCTRRMVIKHMGIRGAHDITKARFEELYKKLFEAALLKMI